MTETDLIRVGWYAGSWTMHTDGLGNFTHWTWQPNPRLDMTPDEQSAMNLRSDDINGARACADALQLSGFVPSFC